MKWISIVIATLLMVASCTNYNKVPSGILQGEKWNAILWDVISAERFVQQFYRDSTKEGRDNKTLELYQAVFAVHDITSEQFFKSMEFYLNRPDLSLTSFDSLSRMGDYKRSEIQNREYNVIDE